MKKNTLILILVLTITNIYSQKNENSEIKLKDGWYEINQSNSKIIKVNKQTGEKYSLNEKPFVTPENFKSFKEFKNRQGDKGIAVYFDKTGTENWRIATKNSIGFNLVFILDNEIFCAQIVNSEITGGVSAFWKNQQTENEWNKLKKILN